MNTPIRILGIAGSLRRGSYNRAALRAATELAPKGATVETFELDGIPPFNQALAQIFFWPPPQLEPRWDAGCCEAQGR
jgi:NAD(P)H-dependent FMN reductase